MKKYFYLLFVIPLILTCTMPQNLESSYRKFWKKGGYFKQTNIILKNYDNGIIRARVDNRWQNFKIRKLPVAFVDWSTERRLETLDEIRKGGMPALAGAHNGMVASHGARRRDGQFSINCAVKGMGFLPNPENIEKMIATLKSTFDASDSVKLLILEGFYKNAKEVFDLTKQVSLELYSIPKFETHSFINQMTDPGVSIVFLDFPSYEIRAITQLLHPSNPRLTQYERNVVEYINTIHDYFHSRSPRQSIGVIYHVIEVFDNTPGRARGKRVIPPLP